MPQARILNRMLGVAMLAMMFGSTSLYAQSSKDTSGMTKENKPGQMSATGQNETSGGSAAKSTSGSSDTSAMSGKSGGKPLSRADEGMMRDLAYANLSEIDAGKMAQSKSQNDQVKNFAQRMIDDHTKAQQELQQLADAKGVKLPTEPDAKHKAEAKMMGALSGDKFDKMYMQRGGLTDHRNTHKLLARVEDKASDPDLKSLASKMMPTVDQHLTMAQEMRGEKSTATGSSGARGKSMSGPGTSKDTDTSGKSDSMGK